MTAFSGPRLSTNFVEGQRTVAPFVAPAPPEPEPEPFVPNAVDFTAGYLSNEDGLGPSAATELSFAIWLNKAAMAPDTDFIKIRGSRIVVRLSDGKIQVDFTNGSDGIFIYGNTPIPSDEWVCILGSCRVGTPSDMQIYLGDTEDLDAGNSQASAGPWTVNWTNGINAIGQSGKALGCLSEVWLKSEFIDFSVEANRRKFIDADGNPVPLGEQGELPTGTQSEICMTGNAANAGVNSGSIGNYTIVDSLADCTSAPGSA